MWHQPVSRASGAARALPLLAGFALLSGVAPRAAAAQTLIENSVEAQFQMDVHVPDAALAAMIPAGFTLNVATQGAANRANIRVIFVDRLTIHNGEGDPVGSGSHRTVYMIAPVQDPAGNNAQLVIGGITTEARTPRAPFGNYLAATSHSMTRSVTSESGGPVLETQEWSFEAAGGEHIAMTITFERGVPNRGNQNEVRFYSAEDPSLSQISRQERVLEILRNVTTTPPDRVREFSFDAGRWELRRALRRYRRDAELGQHHVGVPLGAAAVESSLLAFTRCGLGGRLALPGGALAHLPMHEVEQVRVVNRLHEPGVEQVARVVPVSRRVTGHCYDGRPVQLAAAPQLLGDRVTVQSGQPQVEQHQVRWLAPRCGDAGMPVRREPHSVAYLLEQDSQSLGVVLVVIDYEGFPPVHGFGRRKRRIVLQPQARWSLGQNWKPQGKLAPTANAATRRPDASAMELRQALDEGQADPEPGVRPIEGRIELHEGLENRLELLRRDTGSIVAAPDDHLGRGRSRRSPDVGCQVHGEVNVAAVGGVLGGVGKQVREDLRDTTRIRVDENGIARHRHPQAVAVLSDQLGHRSDGRVDALAQVHDLPVQLDLSSPNPRHVDEIVHQPSELIDLTRDQVFGPRPAVFVRILGEQGHTRRNGSKRVPELVAEHGQELVLSPVCL